MGENGGRDTDGVELTIRDIAKLAGVSTATVSRVLNDSGYVGAKTRAQVLQVIDSNNYQPSAVARGLSRRESTTIGVMVPQLANDFFGQILTGIGDVIDAHHLTMMLYNTDNDVEKEFRFLESLREQRVRGLIITTNAGYSGRTRIRELQTLLGSLAVPVVMMDRRTLSSHWDGVYFDNFNGACLATETLLRGGNRTIGAIVSDIKLDLGRKRRDGFLAALEAGGMTPAARHLHFHDGVLTSHDAYLAVIRMIETNNLPDALFLSNGMIARGFFKAILERGLQLRRDICCIGFDYNDLLDILNLEYSYVERNSVSMGKVAAELLLQRTRGIASRPREHIIPPKLVLRGSEARL